MKSHGYVVDNSYSLDFVKGRKRSVKIDALRATREGIEITGFGFDFSAILDGEAEKKKEKEKKDIKETLGF